MRLLDYINEEHLPDLDSELIKKYGEKIEKLIIIYDNEHKRSNNTNIISRAENTLEDNIKKVMLSMKKEIDDWEKEGVEGLYDDWFLHEFFHDLVYYVSDISKYLDSKKIEKFIYQNAWDQYD